MSERAPKQPWLFSGPPSGLPPYLDYFNELFRKGHPNMDEINEHLARVKEAVEIAAKAAHNINNEYRKALGEAVKPAWEDCSAELRNSVRSGVEGILAGDTPEKSHANWLAFKTQHGWSYDTVEDPIRKTHPCMLPYAQLPPEQRLKDTIFHSVVRGVLIQHGLIKP